MFVSMTGLFGIPGNTDLLVKTAEAQTSGTVPGNWSDPPVIQKFGGQAKVFQER